ncbi:MAG TPA: hypothetical protein VFI25_02040 [Planctomycetota bacterium]|jgi:hypothetical protein|nr:hypothetical protein [Planctomycetota bacterium]
MSRLSRAIPVVGSLAALAAVPFLTSATGPASTMCHDILVSPNGAGTIRLDLTMGARVEVPSPYAARVAVIAAKPTEVSIGPAAEEEVRVIGTNAAQTVSFRARRGTAGAKLEPGMRLLVSPKESRSLTVSTSAAATLILGPEEETSSPSIVAAPPARPAPPVTPH